MKKPIKDQGEGWDKQGFVPSGPFNITLLSVPFHGAVCVCVCASGGLTKCVGVAESLRAALPGTSSRGH